jgi:Tfp pilus assembly protein PilN
MIEINLLPGVTRKAKRTGAPFSLGATLAAAGARVKNPYLVGMIAAVVVSLVAAGGLYATQTARRHTLERRKGVAVRDSARMAGMLKARSKAEAARDSVYMQIAIIKSIDDSRYKWPHLLEEINLAIPPYTWLTAVTQTSAVTTAAASPDTMAPANKKSAKGKKDEEKKPDATSKRAHADSLYNGVTNDTKFRIVGQTVDIQALTLFMKNLEGSPFIKNVQLTRSDLVSGQQDVTQFELEAESEIPPKSMLQTTPLSVAVH